MAGGGLEIEQRAIRDTQLVADDDEAPAGVVEEGEAGAVSSVRIVRRQDADNRAVRYVLVHRRRRQADVGRRLVDIIHANRETFIERQPAAVGDPHRDVVAGGGLEIEERAIRDTQLVADDGETPSGVVEQRESSAVPGIRIARRQDADDRAVSRILVHRCYGQADAGRRLVNVVHANRETFIKRQPTAVGDPHRDVVAGGGLEIEQRAIRDTQLVADDDEAPAGVVEEGEAGAVSSVRIVRRQDADNRAVRYVLVHRRRRQADVGRRLVDIIHANRETFIERQPAAVGDPHRDVVAGGGLEIEERAIRDTQLVADDGEAPAGIVEERETGAVPSVRITRRQDADNRAVGDVLIDRRRRQADVGRRLVDIVYGATATTTAAADRIGVGSVGGVG